MFGWAHGISSPGVLVPRTSIWAQKGANAVSTVITSCMFSQLFRHSRLKLGGVYPIRSERAPTLYHASYATMRFISAWCLSVLPKLQPLFFLFRQHISLPSSLHLAQPSHPDKENYHRNVERPFPFRHIIPRASYARPTVWGMKSPAGGGRHCSRFTASRSSLPGLNFTVLCAGMGMLSPVRGLRPWRAGTSTTSNTPKP